MTEILKQVALLPPGCQRWNYDVLSAAGNRVAYCSTVAIYIFKVLYILIDSSSTMANRTVTVSLYVFVHCSTKMGKTFCANQL